MRVFNHLFLIYPVMLSAKKSRDGGVPKESEGSSITEISAREQGQKRVSVDERANPIEPTCPYRVSLTLNRGTLCFNEFVPAPLVKSPYGSAPLRKSSSCNFLDRVYGHRLGFPQSFQPTLQSIPSPPAPIFPYKSLDGVPEYVPMPCKICDQDRKDRLFIRGSPYSASSAKLLVDHANSQAGGKIVAHSDGLRGVSDILAVDGNRYLLSLCANHVWFTVRLADEIFVEKIGLIATELFASTFRHIQILGSRQYPTNEWRVLGEIETNPMETQEWFDLSAASQCSKCYVKYLKLRVLTHHALEGYGNCALTRLQVFGSTVLQSLDKIQSMNSTVSVGSGNGRTPAYIRMGSRGHELVDSRIRLVIKDSSGDGSSPSHPDDKPPITPAPEVPTTTNPPHQTVSSQDEENSPLLKFIEEMTQLKKQYHSVAASVFALNEIIMAQQALIDGHGDHPDPTIRPTGPPTGNETLILSQQPPVPPSKVTVTILGIPFSFSSPRSVDLSHILIGVVLATQMVVLLALGRSNRRSAGSLVTPSNSSIIVSLDDEPTSQQSDMHFHARRNTSARTLSVQINKKRHHGLWRPKPRRLWPTPKQAAIFTPPESDLDVQVVGVEHRTPSPVMLVNAP